MKTASMLLAALLSAQVAADCSDIEFEPTIPDGLEAVASDNLEARDEVPGYTERREAYLDCLKPAPFVQERIVIELDEIADDFSREQARFPVRTDEAVAAN